MINSVKTKFTRAGSVGRGFTLVELLVVIAIIGLLSSVAVVSMSNSREKARIAGARSFEAQLDRTLGSALVARYDFEEGSGTTTSDLSGSGNNGTLVSTPAWSTDTPFAESKNSLSFSGANYVQLASGFGVSNSNFTVSTWVKTTVTGGQMSFMANTGAGNGYRFGLTGGPIYFLIGIGANTEGGCTTKRANDGNWHHLAIAFSRTGLTVSCYIDGQLSGKINLPSAYAGASDAAWRIGTAFCCTAFVGLIDNVRVYAQDMSGVSFYPPARPPEIAKLLPADRPRSVLYW